MKKIFTISSLGILTAVFLTACLGRSFKAEDAVLADWYLDSWHRAVLVAECNKDGTTPGWTVDFKDDFYDNDASPDCYPLYAITRDEVLDEKDITVGEKYLVEWFEDSFATAEVTAVGEGKFSFKFVSDGYEADYFLDQIRVMSEVERPAEDVEGDDEATEDGDEVEDSEEEGDVEDGDEEEDDDDDEGSDDEVDEA